MDDEIHLITPCTFHDKYRTILLDYVSKFVYEPSMLSETELFSVIMSSKCHNVILQLGRFLRFCFTMIGIRRRRQIGPSLGTTCLHPRITLCYIFQICAYSPSTHNGKSVINCPLASGFNCFYNWLILLWLLFSGADKGPTYITYCVCLPAP